MLPQSATLMNVQQRQSITRSLAASQSRRKANAARAGDESDWEFDGLDQFEVSKVEWEFPCVGLTTARFVVAASDVSLKMSIKV